MQILSRSSLAIVGSLSLTILIAASPTTASAKEKKHKKNKHAEIVTQTGVAPVQTRVQRQIQVLRPSYQTNRSYYSAPRSSFSVTLGDGYRGRGYYYGPANSPYYYDSPGVSYYRSEALIPARYRYARSYDRGYESSYAASPFRVQQALARRGYYNGAIDGVLGDRSQVAIAHFQADNGMRQTGRVDGRLLAALGM
ncbi:MAG: peptidoglycan-binding domain-containing protein [Verrucomicrobiota bacterium]